MAETQPFVLLDDARTEGASDAHLFEDPRELFVARRPEEVLPVLEAAEAARLRTGGTLAGYLAYEAGLALEPRLAPLAGGRSGADGPLVWFGLFDAATIIPSAEVPRWLAERAGAGPVSIGPLEPQVSTGGYLERFARLQEAIRAGDIYQANLTMPLAGPARGGRPGARRPAAAPRGDPARGRGGLGRGDLRELAVAAVVQPRAALQHREPRGARRAGEGPPAAWADRGRGPGTGRRARSLGQGQ